MTSRKMQQGAAMQGDEAKLGGTGPVGLRQPSAICWMAPLHRSRQQRHYIFAIRFLRKSRFYRMTVPGPSLARVLFKRTVRELMQKVEENSTRTLHSVRLSVYRA